MIPVKPPSVPFQALASSRIHNSLTIVSRISIMSLAGIIFSDHSRALTLNEKFSEMPLDQFRSATLDHLEDMRRFLSAYRERTAV